MDNSKRQLQLSGRGLTAEGRESLACRTDAQSALSKRSFPSGHV